MKKIIAVVVVMLAGVCFAQSPRQVEVVAEVALTNQTGSTGGTLFIPAQTGRFRVNFMVQCTTGAQPVGPRLFWTDDHAGEAYSTNVSCGLPHTSPAAVLIIKAIAGQPIGWAVFGQEGQVYDVYLTLERIGPKTQ
jgi:hypothetical protein